MSTAPATGQGLHDAGRKATRLAAALILEARSPRTRRDVFVGMDALRAATALTILVYHAHAIMTKGAASQGVAIFVEPQWRNACLGLFLVMSGVLMVRISQTLYGSTRGVLICAFRRAS